MQPWNLSELNFGDVKNREFEVAMLPLGATEPHNLHLPYGTDNYEAGIVAEHICRAAHERGAKIVLLPTIPFGTETNMRQFPLAINVNPTTLYALVTDVIESLEGDGIRKIVLLNAHGGNEMKPLLRELYGKSKASIFLCNWYQSIHDIYHEIFDEAEDHAGEMETSLMLAYFPHLVAQRDGRTVADDGSTAQSKFDALNHGWVSITRPWHLLTQNTGSGNPHAATAEKGRRLMEHLVERIGTFLVELSNAEVDAKFPY